MPNYFGLTINVLDMRTIFIICALNFFTFSAFAQAEPFTRRTVISGLNSPWEVTYGPNDSLWITENVSYLVKRVSVSTGAATTLLNLSGIKNFSPGDGGRWPQGGLMGMALHPALYSSEPSIRAAKPWVFLAFVFNRPTGQNCSTNSNSSDPCNFLTRIVRYDYSGNTLINPVIVLDNIPGSNDHNSGRLVIGPDEKLYYTIGDLGAGQFNNTSRTNHAQTLDVLEGKVIRLNTEHDGDTGADGWVPDNNPFYNGAPISPRDYVYSMGHRNAQGLVWAQVSGMNRLYASEHGDRTDDEINLITAGNNFAWNRVSGYCDNNYNGMTLGGYSPVHEGNFCSATPTVQEPIFTMFTKTAAEISALSSDYLTWPTVAPSGVEYYGFGKIPGWDNSLLIPCLKAGKVYRVKLDPAGTAVTTVSAGRDTVSYFRGQGRFRDIAISPGGLKFYLACDATGQTSGPTGSFNGGGTPPPNAGSIQEFTYTGTILPVTSLPSEGLQRTAKDIRMYPVPAGKELTVSVPSMVKKPFRVIIFNANGIKINGLISRTNRLTIPVAHLQPGIYVVQVEDASGTILHTEKMIKL
jgi:PQQ-dependent dehydrogenase (s-GDH family)